MRTESGDNLKQVFVFFLLVCLRKNLNVFHKIQHNSDGYLLFNSGFYVMQHIKLFFYWAFLALVLSSSKEKTDFSDWVVTSTEILH